MSHAYRAVGWNRQKRRYDFVIAAGVLLSVASFAVVGALLHPQATAETLLIRGLGITAFAMLHLILCIGPLCRLDARFLPLLYNRRHFGVSMFLVALLHGGFSLIQFHAFGDLNPLVSLLAVDYAPEGLAWFPFQPLGFAALAILFLMAATSHDFWLAQLSAPVWKALHMLVYVAYGLLVLHVALGALQTETSVIPVTLLSVGLGVVLGLHLLAGFREVAADARSAMPSQHNASKADAWLDVAACDDIPDGRARIVNASGERVAVFRWGDRFVALSNACQHQNGPLGEGRILDGCVTCPWHGYQYQPDCGRSPEPFHEAVPTFAVRVRAGRVELDPHPFPAGTPQTPAPRPHDGEAR
ncbi:MAG: hypothetical protein DHS20C15_15230 [Planctomycetota bacterium]|nr:MAG: hypothetical protein DHS20C15_15230 [Planctomycetota bacterium]